MSKDLKVLWIALMFSSYLGGNHRRYGVHLRTKIIENKIQFEAQKLDYPCRNLVYKFEIAMNAVEIASFELEVTTLNKLKL